MVNCNIWSKINETATSCTCLQWEMIKMYGYITWNREYWRILNFYFNMLSHIVKQSHLVLDLHSELSINIHYMKEWMLKNFKFLFYTSTNEVWRWFQSFIGNFWLAVPTFLDKPLFCYISTSDLIIFLQKLPFFYYVCCLFLSFSSSLLTLWNSIKVALSSEPFFTVRIHVVVIIILLQPNLKQTKLFLFKIYYIWYIATS